MSDSDEVTEEEVVKDVVEYQRSLDGDPVDTSTIEKTSAAELTADVFEKHMFEEFAVSMSDACGSGGSSMQLVDVDRLHALRHAEGGFDHRPREPFTLLFRADHDKAVPEGIHSVAHESVGVHELAIFAEHPHEEVGESENPRGRFYSISFD